MGWTVDFIDFAGRSVSVGPHNEGSIRSAIGPGEDTAVIDVTYNYARFFYEALDQEDGLRWLNGKNGAETCGRLLASVQKLSDDDGGTNSYWAVTPANAKRVLVLLASWAQQHPTAIWRLY